MVPNLDPPNKSKSHIAHKYTNMASLPPVETVDRLPLKHVTASTAPTIMEALESTPKAHTSQDPAALLVVPPHPSTRRWNNETGYWSDMDFNPELKLPQEIPFGVGMVIQLQAKGAESLLICLSSQPGFILGEAYVVELGGGNNTKVAIRKRLTTKDHGGCKTVERNVGPTMNAKEFLSYWVCMRSGILSVGIGTEVGKDTLCEMDDNFYDVLRSGLAAPKFVGVGNASQGGGGKGKKGTEVEVKHLTVRGMAKDCECEPMVEEIGGGGGGGGGGNNRRR